MKLFIYFLLLTAYCLTLTNFQCAVITKLPNIDDFSGKNQLCRFCPAISPVLLSFVKKKQSQKISEFFLFLCKHLLDYDENVCKGWIRTYKEPVLTIFTNPNATGDLCSAIFQCTNQLSSLEDWDIQWPNVTKPPIQSIMQSNPSAPKLRILHLTDLHVDYEYDVGSPAVCKSYMCCRHDSPKKPGYEASQAGYWGTVGACDIPVWTVEDMFGYISKNEQFDFIYWTGDLPPHDNYEQSRRENLESLSKLSGLYSKYFPNKTTYSAVGNHESYPANLFPTPSTPQDNITWLYEALAENWIQYGLPKNLTNNITRGAFYTVMIGPKTRLISLNMNYCYYLNFWLYINPKDPLDQLSWLANVLQESENNGEKVMQLNRILEQNEDVSFFKVHIIGHQSPGASCLPAFSEVYYKIVNRYEATIAAQFFGHWHNDYVEIFYDLNNLTRPINVAYITPSVTTYTQLNIAYRIFEVDAETLQVHNHETTYLDVNEANLKGYTTWRKEYDVHSAFGMICRPEDWNNLTNEMLKDLNGEKAEKFINYYYKMVPTDCDRQCREKIIFNLKQARADKFIKS